MSPPSEVLRATVIVSSCPSGMFCAVTVVVVLIFSGAAGSVTLISALE